MTPEPFDDSRRLTGCNVYFAGPGAALETARGLAFGDDALDRWRANIARARARLDWPDGEVYVRRHTSGASLAFAAPLDQLYTATEVNEWAWSNAVASPFSPREKVAEGRMRAEAIGPDGPARKKFPLDEETLQFVRHLRADTTDAKQLFWLFLRDRRLHGQKFRRQKTLGPYVLDFYCHELKLAIELDDGQHNDDAHARRDARRDAFVAEQGIKTLRYWNHDAMQRTEDVLADLSAEVLSRMEAASQRVTPTPSSALRAPSPGGRRENQEPYHAPGHAAIWDEASALHTLRLLAKAEANPALIALRDAAMAHRLPFLADDDEATLGAGEGGRSWFIDELPAPETVPWQKLHGIPATLVTGSNGKTTTVRLIAAMCRAHGWHTAHSCTDGVFFDGGELEAGDFSGPAGARTALRQGGAQAAVLETARGGLLRRGLALCHADAAVVTNISVDHFGEYGVHDLDDLTRVKLTVARAIGTDGLLVLNADDGLLREHAKRQTCPLGWFALDFDHPLLAAHRQTDGATCGVRDGRLRLHVDGTEHDLGAVAAMPLTLGGRAGYNIANIAAAALAATAMGIVPATIMAALAAFGTAHGDNPGRLQHWRFGDTQVFVDYAHNPEGLHGLFDAVGANTRRGRLALLLGHAGNREDADLRAVAATAASVRPDFAVLKDIAGYERGRAAGEIAAIMRAQLLADGVAADAIATCLDETEAARTALAWARDGDLLVLPLHEMDARARVGALLDEMTKTGWKSGDPLP